MCFPEPLRGGKSAHQLSISGGRNHACVICIWPPLCSREAQRLAGQEPGPTAKNRLKRHHSNRSGFQSPSGNKAKLPSRILKGEKVSTRHPATLYGDFRVRRASTGVGSRTPCPSKELTLGQCSSLVRISIWASKLKPLTALDAWTVPYPVLKYSK